MTFSRTIRIRAENLGENITLMFAFDGSRDQIAWRVIAIGATGNYMFTLTFTSESVFASIPIGGGGVIVPREYVQIEAGQMTEMTQNGFTNPVHTSGIPPKSAKAVNKSGSVQGLGVGFLNGGRVNLQLAFPHFNNDGIIVSQFPSVVSGYATSQYQEGELIRGEIISPKIWGLDFLSGGPDDYSLKYDPGSGRVSIVPAN